MNSETPSNSGFANTPTSQEGSAAPVDIMSQSNISLAASSAASSFEVQEAELKARVAALQVQEQALRQEITTLQATRNQLLKDQTSGVQASVEQFIKEGLKELEQRKQALQVAVDQLERRQERIRTEMRTTFAGVSQDLAIRVQSFKEYLVGSLQDLVGATEQLDLVPTATPTIIPLSDDALQLTLTPKFAEQSFEAQAKQIQALIDQYRTQPDYYGPTWQLRRTFEPIHAERVSNWFFSLGGRGALRTMGSRLQNILVTAAIVSILYALYGDRLYTLVLVNSPERIGEWRRGLQDSLGITRTDFGPEGGAAIFEDPEVLILKADRLQKEGDMPLIIIDETGDLINLGLLQFPLWLAFAPDPQASPVFEW
jgi:hypothetical protein